MELTQQAYDMLINYWGVDGDHSLLSVADHLAANDRARAVKALDEQIGCVTATLRAYIALRSALVMQDSTAIEAIREKDTTDIDDWPDRLEA